MNSDIISVIDQIENQFEILKKLLQLRKSRIVHTGIRKFEGLPFTFGFMELEL